MLLVSLFYASLAVGPAAWTLAQGVLQDRAARRVLPARIAWQVDSTRFASYWNEHFGPRPLTAPFSDDERARGAELHEEQEARAAELEAALKLRPSLLDRGFGTLLVILWFAGSVWGLLGLAAHPLLLAGAAVLTFGLRALARRVVRVSFQLRRARDALAQQLDEPRLWPLEASALRYAAEVELAVAVSCLEAEVGNGQLIRRQLKVPGARTDVDIVVYERAD